MNDYSILRNALRFESNFAQIPNKWVRDDRIGFRAKGVLVYLLSHKSGWKTSIGHLAEVSTDGRDAIRTAVLELEAAGYLTRTRLRDNGQLAGSEWELLDPFDLDAEMPMLENPTQENPMQENPTVKKTNINKTTTKENQDISTQNQFEEFWLLYPRRTSKGSAKIAYAKALKKIDHDNLMGAVLRYVSDPNLPEPQFIPHPSTWLNQERWLDGNQPERKKPSSTSDNARAILERAMILDAEGEQRKIGH